MDLEQFLVFAGSAIGIAFVVLANRLITGARTAHIEGREAAMARFRLDFPEFECDAALISDDLKTALLTPEQPVGNAIGLVRVMGDKLITRMLVPGTIARARLDGEGDHNSGPALDLRLNDLSLPHVKIGLGEDRDPEEIAVWLKRLEQLADENMEVRDHGI